MNRRRAVVVLAGVLLLGCFLFFFFARRPPSVEPRAAPEKEEFLVPEGFRSRPGTVAEPYSNTGWAKEVVHKKTGVEMVFIPAGEFMMGDTVDRPPVNEEEGPAHRVRITKPFYMGKYEVTQGEWEKVMGYNESWFKYGPRLPVDTLEWKECQAFCGKAGNGLRLPTEAEWEYACRAGSRGQFCFRDVDGKAEDWFWYYVNSGGSTHKVGEKRPNAWGLFDMHGNVAEWCQDWYGERYYAESPVDDPPGPADGLKHVHRGGAWFDNPWYCRTASRIGVTPGHENFGPGFRLVLGLK